MDQSGLHNIKSKGMAKYHNYNSCNTACVNRPCSSANTTVLLLTVDDDRGVTTAALEHACASPSFD